MKWFYFIARKNGTYVGERIPALTEHFAKEQLTLMGYSDIKFMGVTDFKPDMESVVDVAS